MGRMYNSIEGSGYCNFWIYMSVDGVEIDGVETQSFQVH